MRSHLCQATQRDILRGVYDGAAGGSARIWYASATSARPTAKDSAVCRGSGAAAVSPAGSVGNRRALYAPLGGSSPRCRRRYR